MSLVLNNLSKLDWIDDTSHLLLNPKLPHNHIQMIYESIHKISDQNHLYLATSGTSNSTVLYKIVALHKNAFLNSAHSVNDAFCMNRNDVLLNILPTFHVGGLSLIARSFCADAQCMNLWHEKFVWDPKTFVNACAETKATITSLVPTQIFDLVKLGFIPPQSLRCIFVGGSAISIDLFVESRKLGWPVFPTYGMTECCSQVATYDPHLSMDTQIKSEDSDGRMIHNIPLKVLPHLSVSIDQDSKIQISGNSLLSYYINIQDDNFEIVDPKINRVFKTNDLGLLDHNGLFVFGRADDNIKINGEFVNLNKVNQVFQKYMCDENMDFDYVLANLKNDRTGSELIGVFLTSDYAYEQKIKKIQAVYNNHVLSHERFHKIKFVETIPKTDLGKINIKKLQEILQADQAVG